MSAPTSGPTGPAAVSEALMEVSNSMLPIIEACEGQRKLLEERGWSPTAAEQYSLALLLGLTQKMFSA